MASAARKTPAGMSHKGKRVSFFQNVTTTGSNEVVLSKVSRLAIADPIALSTEGNRSHVQTMEPENRSSARSKRKLPNDHDSCENAAKKRVPSPPAHLSTAFQRLQNDPAGKPWHAHDLHTSNHGMKTPSPEVSHPTEPKRELSPAVARSATYPQAGLAAIKTSNFRPSRSRPNETDSGSKRYFDMSRHVGDEPAATTGKAARPKKCFFTR